MLSAASIRKEYERRFHRVFSYIDDNLERRISVEELARKAAFSEFHFHRLFSAHHGESVGNYIARRRLEVAAMRLSAQPRLGVLEVALSVGFGSSEAFSRAFKQRFGQAPSVWRKTHENRRMDQVDSRMDHADAVVVPYDVGMPSNRSNSAIKVDLVNQPTVEVHYHRYQGTFGPPLSRFWSETVVPWLVRNQLFDRRRYGLCHDDPVFTKSSQCRYDAGVETGGKDLLDDEANRTTIPGGLYACTRFWGTSAEILGVWDEVLRSWMPASGYQIDSRPFLERYEPDFRFDETSGKFECDILVPVTKLF